MGGDRRSRIWASFSPSTHWTSRVRSNGQLELQRAETAIHEQPDSTKSRSPGGAREGATGQVMHPSPHSCTFGVTGPVLTRQPVDEPAQLFLGDIGPAEVQGHRLSPDDAAQHQGRDGLAVVQGDAGPQPLIAAPGGQPGKGVIRAGGSLVKPSAWPWLMPPLQAQGGAPYSTLWTLLVSSHLPLGASGHLRSDSCRASMEGAGTDSPVRT